MHRITTIVSSIALSALCAGVAAAQCLPVVHQKIVEPATVAFDFFGDAVAIDGDRAIVGAYGDDTQGGFAGAAYIYHRVGSTWQKQAKLLAPDGAAEARFGTSVAIRGNWAVVGAAHHDLHGENAGSVYVWRLVGSTWVFAAQLFPPEPEQFGFFGCSVSTDGDRIAVGSYFEDVTIGGTNYASNGAAYVFRRVVGGPSDGDWVHEQSITQLDGQGSAWFGYSVAIEGDRLVVGAPQKHKAGFGFWTGAAYFFERGVDDTWTQTTKVHSPDSTSSERFGRSVALSGDRAVVGAPMHKSPGADYGAVYTFARNGGGTWALDQKVAPVDAEQASQFGERVAMSGNRIAVGAWSASITGMSQRGNAWVFSRGNGGWSAGSKLLDSTPGIQEHFGNGVGISGEYMIVGCPRDVNGESMRGSATIFKHNCAMPTCGPDINNDGEVNGADLGILLAAWGGVGVADINGDGIVNGADLGMMLAAWGACP